MIRDLETEDFPQEIACDLCIVGAGAAGLTLAHALGPFAQAKSLSIVILESGGFDPTPEIQDLYQGFIAGQPLELAATRLRCFGGSTQHWTGMTRPLLESDMKPRAWMQHSGWPITYQEIARHYPRACKLLELGAFDYDPFANPHPDGPALKLPAEASISTCLYRFSPPVRMGATMRPEVEASKAITTILHANVTELVPNAQANRIERIDARTFTGKTIRVRAKRFVLAAGGIANARLLLMSRSIEKTGVGNARDVVGRYFLEHPHIDLGATLVAIDADTKSARNSWWRPYAMRNTTSPVVTRHALCVSSQGQEREKICGFVALPHWRSMQPLPTQGPVSLDLMLMTEQEPHPDSRVLLARDQSPDGLGLPRTRLAWRVGEHDLKTMRVGVRLLAQELGSRGLGLIREGKAIQPDRFPHHEDVYPGGHHMGTTRMGTDTKTSVVNADSLVHGYDNFFIAGSSVFPTGGFCNPTLTIVALALRLASTLQQAIEAEIKA